MNEYQRLIDALRPFQSVAWINQYFDLVKKLLTELNITGDDPRLAMSLPFNGKLPINIGQRYVLRPAPDYYVRCIVPASFAEESVGGTFIFGFTRNKEVDAKFVEVAYPIGRHFPDVLYNACVDACMDILRRSKKSGFRKHHVSLLYDFTMEPAVRKEVLGELKLLKDA